MKKFFAIILTLILICFCTFIVSAETTDNTSSDVVVENEPQSDQPSDTIVETETALEETLPTEAEPADISSSDTAIPAVERIVNFLFDGKITVSQIIEYTTIILMAAFSFAYNKYKRKLLLKEKAISKTDVEIEELKAREQDMSNQVALLGNMIVCAYLSNNLVDPELKKKLAVYAEELMKNTTINKDTLTEKLICIAKNPDFQAKVTELKEGVAKQAEQSQEIIENIKEDVSLLVESINQNDSQSTQAADVIDSLKVGG